MHRCTIHLLLLITIICTISSCSKKTEDSNSVQTSFIVGKWVDHAMHEVVTSPSDPTFQQVYDTTYPTGMGPYMQFNANKTYSGTLNFTAGLIANGTFELKDSLLITTTTWTSTTHTTETYNFKFVADTLVLWHTYGDTNITYKQYDTMIRQ